MKKTIMVHIDGVPSRLCVNSGDSGPLEAANLPHLNRLAGSGEFGRLGIPNESRPFVGELVLLSLLGYDSHKWYSGPGTFQAFNLDVALDRHDVAFLCDFVTLRSEDGWGDGKKLGPLLVMDDFSGGQLETEDARELLDAINEQLVSENIQFYVGHNSHHLMVWAGGNGKIGCRNPREASDQSIEAYLPVGEGGQILRELMEASRAILGHHPVNQERMDSGLKPANCLWLWGPGKPVELPTLQERWPIQGVVVSSSGAYLGVGRASGLRSVPTEPRSACESHRLDQMVDIGQKILEKHDFACLHIPCAITDTSDEKLRSARFVECLEQIDQLLIKNLTETFVDTGQACLLVVVTSDPGSDTKSERSTAPYVFCGGQESDHTSAPTIFSERELLDRPLRNATTFFERSFAKQ